MSMSTSSTSGARKAGLDGAPLLRLAQRVAKERRPDEAEALLRRARPGTAATSVIDRELARLLQSQRRYGEAERQWRQVVVAAPDDPAALHGLLRVLRLRHRLADAESEVADGSRRWPDSRQLALEAARIAAQREFYPQAVLRYQRALALPGPAAEAMGELAQTLMAQHRFAPAAALLDRLAAAEPDQPRWRESLARAAQEEGDVERALAHWRAIIDLVPKEMGARVALGRLLEDAGRLAEADAAFRDLADLHPDAIEPYCQLGRMALFQSSFASAEDWLKRALAMRPGDPWATALLVKTLAAQNRFRRASGMARELAERVPDHLDASLLVPWTLERAGRIERAAAELRRVCSLFPQAFQPGLRLAELLVRDGKLDLAWAALEDAHACNPDTLSITLARIDVLFAKSQPVGVAALLEPLYAEYPSHREVKKRVARLEVESGRYVPARRLWREVTRFDRRVSGPPLHFERLDELPIPPAGGEIRLFTRIRNERVRLPWLLDFYRSQGVDRFFVVDNASEDGSRDYLLARPDTHVFLTTDSYALFGGGMRWLNHLLDLHGSGGWCVTVDVDEVLAYPHAETLGLKLLTAHLDHQGAQGLFAFMLDMYAQGDLREATYAAGDHPLALCPCFDRSGYIRRQDPDFPFRLVTGGLVSRFLYDRTLDGVLLHKVPLVRWQEGLRYTSSTHTLFPVPLAKESGVLLHFKYISDFVERARIEAERKQYWQGAKRYTDFTRRMQSAQSIDFRCELTERFRSTAQLVELGLLESTPELEALVASGPPADPLPAWRLPS
jgi:Flp pilus assembly protein TadD